MRPVLLLLAACGPRRPAPAPEPEPEPLAPARFELVTGVYREPSFGVVAPRDVWVRGPDDLTVIRDDVVVSGVWWCTDEGCLLPVVSPGEQVRFTATADATVELRPLRVPEARTIVPGETVELPLAPVAEGDPRGPIADVRFHLDAPGDVRLDVRPVHEAPDHGGVHFVDFELFGPRGPAHARVFAHFDDEPGRRQNVWPLGPGDWTLRIHPEDASFRAIYCEPSEPFPERAPPAWCAEEADAGPFAVRVTWIETTAPEEPVAPAPEVAPEVDLRLADEPVAIEVRAEPPPVGRAVRVPPGHDVIVTWEPRDVFVATAWTSPAGETERYCHEWPCVHAVADFDRLELRVGNAPEPRAVSLTVDALPLPDPIGELEPGYVMTLSTAPVAPGDPRGPLADLALRIAEPGEYLLGAAYDGAAGPPVRLTLATPWGGRWTYSVWNVLGGEDYVAQRVVIEEAGRYLLRVDGVGPDVPARQLDVELQRVED